MTRFHREFCATKRKFEKITTRFFNASHPTPTPPSSDLDFNRVCCVLCVHVRVWSVWCVCGVCWGVVCGVVWYVCVWLRGFVFVNPPSSPLKVDFLICHPVISRNQKSFVFSFVGKRQKFSEVTSWTLYAVQLGDKQNKIFGRRLRSGDQCSEKCSKKLLVQPSKLWQRLLLLGVAR